MDIGTIVLLALNLIFFVALFSLWKKTNKRRKDDPRLSRGLQLLQSKISVLEDLSDRTDLQVKQLIHLLEAKTRQLQTKIFESEKQIQRIDQSMHKSLEVADIFQDKIPHEEIIERQTSVKYIQAAQLAHQGKKVDEIVKLVGLPKGEVEFISKVNKDQLMFDKQTLPSWAKKQFETQQKSHSDVDRLIAQSYDSAFNSPKADMVSLKQLGKEFRDACREYEDSQQQPTTDEMISEKLVKAKQWTQKVSHQAGDFSGKLASQANDFTNKFTQQAGVMLQGALTKNNETEATEGNIENTKKVSTESVESINFEFNKSPAVGFEIDFDDNKIMPSVDREPDQKINKTPNSDSSSGEQKLSLGEALDRVKKVNKEDAGFQKVNHSSEVKKVIFPRIDEPNR